MNNNTSSLVISRSKQQGRPFTSIRVTEMLGCRWRPVGMTTATALLLRLPGSGRVGWAPLEYTDKKENTFQDVPWRQLSHVGVPPWAGGRTRNHPLFVVWTRHSESQGYSCAGLYAITQVTPLMSRACKTVLFLRRCNCSKDNRV